MDKIITITVEGGVIQDVSGIPAGVKVEVIDFDVSDSDKCEMVNGQPAIVSVYKAEEAE